MGDTEARVARGECVNVVTVVASNRADEERDPGQMSDEVPVEKEGGGLGDGVDFATAFGPRVKSGYP